MLEEHGPHLPIASDTIGVEYEARAVADRLGQALPGWSVVMMPVVNYGSSGANQIGNVAIHPGTYGIRQSTLRSLVADIGGQIAQNRFKWVFVMNGHGAPTHHIAVNEACDFVSEVFHATMLNVSGLFNADATIQAQGESSLANTSRRPIWRPLAEMSTPAWQKPPGCLPFAPTWFAQATETCPVTGQRLWGSRVTSRKDPIGLAIFHPPQEPVEPMVERLRSGGWTE